jgi:hypothetical protein
VLSPEESSFPEIAWRGVFADYRAANDGTTEASDAAHFGTSWVASAIACGRNVHMYSGETVYPNALVNFYGPTGDKKTTADRRILSLLDGIPGIKIIQEQGSVEAIADELMAAERGIFLFFWEEIASFLKTASWSGSTLMQMITETYDCPATWGRKYRKNPIDLVDPTPSVLTGTTRNGFGSRPDRGTFTAGLATGSSTFADQRK